MESLFEKLKLGQENENDTKTAHNYFLPKLTEKEIELAEKKKLRFYERFLFRNSDVEKAQMSLSESESKFVLALGKRTSFTIEDTYQQFWFNLFSSQKKYFMNICFNKQ